MTDRVQHSALNMWLLTATIPTLLSVTGHSGWMGVLPVAVVCAILCWAVWQYGSNPLPHWVYCLELGWLIVFAGGIADESGSCWEENSPAIPIILLFLAAFGACRGIVNAARTGATLLWLVLPVLGVVALAGTTDMHWDWISTQTERPDGVVSSLFLVPCMAIFLPGEEKKRGKWIIWLIAAVGVLAAVLLEGVIGCNITGNGFYEFSKGITLLGVAERFEALVSCVLTIGWFTLYCLIFSAEYHIIEKIFSINAGWCLWLCGAVSAGLMCILPKNREWLVVGTLIFWVFLPLITQGFVGTKKVVKK